DEAAVFQHGLRLQHRIDAYLEFPCQLPRAWNARTRRIGQGTDTLGQAAGNTVIKRGGIAVYRFCTHKKTVYLYLYSLRGKARLLGDMVQGAPCASRRLR